MHSLSSGACGQNELRPFICQRNCNPATIWSSVISYRSKCISKPNRTHTHTWLTSWWQLLFFYVHPENCGRWTHFDDHIFPIGLVQPPSSLLGKNPCEPMESLVGGFLGFQVSPLCRGVGRPFGEGAEPLLQKKHVFFVETLDLHVMSIYYRASELNTSHVVLWCIYSSLVLWIFCVRFFVGQKLLAVDLTDVF